MAEIKNNYKIDNLYQGGYSSLSPSYGNLFTGYRASVGTLGVTTSPQTANLLKEVSDKIAPGIKHVEAILMSAEMVESIPKPHLKEIKALSKLTGVDVTVHGPLVEASGFDKSGWSEENRQIVERQMLSAMNVAHQMNDKGEVPVTFHSSAMLPADTYVKTGKDSEEVTQMLVYDQDSGQVVQSKKEERYYPQQIQKKEGGKIYKIGEAVPYSAHERVEIMNDSHWDDEVTKLVAPIEHANTIIREIEPFSSLINEKRRKGIDFEHWEPELRNVYMRYEDARAEIGDVKKHLDSLYEKAYKFGTDEQKKKLRELAINFGKNAEKSAGNDLAQINLLRGIRQALSSRELRPEQFKPLNEFAIEKSMQTFGEVAVKAYDKYGEKSPIISVENPPAWMNAFGRGKDLKNLVEGSREQFVKKAVLSKDKGGLGLSKNKAKAVADRMIGVTWDTNHISGLRRMGFNDKDILKETEMVAPLVKHVHLSDGFGTEHTELPPGMGDLPIKDMLKKLGKKGESARKIIEAGVWWTQFGSSPVAATIEAMGSPLYSQKMSPYWNQVGGFQEGYFSGYGPTFPQINYETFGGGFSQLPSDLGGQRGGVKGSRLGGTPME